MAIDWVPEEHIFSTRFRLVTMHALFALCLCAAAAASSVTPANTDELPPNPWSFGFQCNERYLEW